MTDKPEISDSKIVWLVFGNTDGTEGRGREYIKHVTEIEATAARLGRRGYVQGGNCPITKGLAVKINNSWFIPGEIVCPSKEDITAQERINARREAYEKAVAAGMTQDDIKALGFHND